MEAIDPYSVKAVSRAVDAGEAGAETALAKTLRDVTYGVELELPPGRTVTVTVEMQAIANDRFLPRSLYYLATAYSKRYGTSADDPHGSLRPVWALNILGQNLFSDDTALRLEQFPHHGFAPGSDTWSWRLAFLELSNTVDNPAIAGWIHLFKTGTARPADPYYLHEAASVVKYSNLRPEELKMVDLMEKWRADQATQENYYQRMLAQRVEESRQEAVEDMARELLNAGQAPDWVSEMTGIDVSLLKP